MGMNYGYFAQLSDIAALENSIDANLVAGEEASIEVTGQAFNYDKCRVAGNGPYSYLDLDQGSSKISVIRGGSGLAVEYNLGFSATEPNNIKVENFNDNGVPSYRFYKDDILVRTQASESGENGFWTIKALLSNAAAGKYGALSRLTIKSDRNTIIADWNGNYVLNAAGDDFILRIAADNDPSLAEAGYSFKMYDTTSVSGNHVNLPASTTWGFKSATVLPEVVLSGQTYTFNAPPGFELSRLQFGSYEIPFTFDASTNSGTFTAPELGSSSPFNKFGKLTIKLFDDANGTQSEGETEWAPAPPYVYFNLRGNPDTTMMSNAYYQWQDPPVTTDQPVFDPTHYSISQSDENGDPLFAFYGRLEIKPDAPASFAVNEYIIDDNGIQEFERNSASAVVIGETPQMTLNGPSTVTMTEGDSYTDQGANWTDAEDGSGTVYSDTVINENSSPKTYQQNYSYTDNDGNTVSRRRTVIVEPAQVSISSTINVSITGIPDGPHEVVLHKRGTREVIHDGLLTFSNETASLSIDGVAANEEVYGVWFGDNPPETGTGTYGVTE